MDNNSYNDPRYTQNGNDEYDGTQTEGMDPEHSDVPYPGINNSNDTASFGGSSETGNTSSADGANYDGYGSYGVSDNSSYGSETGTGYARPVQNPGTDHAHAARLTPPQSSYNSNGAYNAQGSYGTPGYGYPANSHINNQPEPAKEKKQNKNSVKPLVAGLIAACMIVSFVFGIGGALFGMKMFGGTNNSTGTTQRQTYNGPSSATATGTTKDNGGKKVELPEGTVAAAAAKASDSVVVITTEALATNFFYGQYVTEGAGSGVIYDAENGYIITCAHVVNGATKITVTLNDGTETTATLVGLDQESDIAVIKIEVDNLVAAEVADSDELVVGQQAVAIGNPLGELGGSVSSGIISALDREITIDGQDYKLLQIDAAVNPGNSGGGLFDISGRLIGIVNAKSSGSDVDGLGFAIPINTAKEIANQLVSQGYVGGRTYLGIQAFEYSKNTSQNAIYQARNSGLAKYVDNYGVYFTDYLEGQSGDLKFGDRIVAIDDTAVSTLADIKSLLTDYSVGDKVTLTVSRLDETTNRAQIIKVELTLIERPPEDNSSSGQTQDQQNDNGGSGGLEQFYGDFFN